AARPGRGGGLRRLWGADLHRPVGLDVPELEKGRPPDLKRRTPGRGGRAFAQIRQVARDQAAAAAGGLISDLFSRATAESRSIRSMAATSRAMRSSADS